MRRRRRGGSWRAAVFALLCTLFPAFAYAPATLAANHPVVAATTAAPAATRPSSPSTLAMARRFVIALASLLGGFALCLNGWSRIDTGRRWQGAALIVTGWLLGISALTLLRLSEDPVTWNWWI